MQICRSRSAPRNGTCEVECDDNLQEFIEVSVENRKLQIKFRDKCAPESDTRHPHLCGYTGVEVRRTGRHIADRNQGVGRTGFPLGRGAQAVTRSRVLAASTACR